jgi:pimeloyl-[acyl-carrier protein] methyl ester esterase
MNKKSITLISGWATTKDIFKNLTKLFPENINLQIINWYDCIDEEPVENCKDKKLTKEIDKHIRNCNGEITLAGFSLGGMLALEYAMSFPEKINKLILISSAARMMTDEGYNGADPRAIQAMQLRLNRKPEKVLTDFAEMCIMPEYDVDFNALFARMGVGIEKNMLMAGLQYLLDFDIRKNIGKVYAPTRIIHGRDDKIVPVSCAEFMAESIEGSTLDILPGKGHALAYTSAERIVKLLTEEK